MSELPPAYIHPNLKLMSPSSDELTRKCPRLFQLYRLTGMIGPQLVPEEDEHQSFGTIVGLGAQEILISNSVSAAYMKMFITWKKDLDDEDGDTKGKNFWDALVAVDNFHSFRNTDLVDYDVAIFDGVPAVELGYRIDCGSGFISRGFLDALLVHRRSRQLVTFECKTTGSAAHEAMYANRGQGLGYNLVVDAIAHKLGVNISAYFVIYCVYQTKKREWVRFDFKKSLTSKVLWIKNTLIHIRNVSLFAEENYWPMNGESCYAFFRPCTYFGVCQFEDAHLIGPLEKVKVKEDNLSRFQFHFTLDEIISSQLAQMTSEEAKEMEI